MIRRDDFPALFERGAPQRGVVHGAPHSPVHHLTDVLVIESSAPDLPLGRSRMQRPAADPANRGAWPPQQRKPYPVLVVTEGKEVRVQRRGRRRKKRSADARSFGGFPSVRECQLDGQGRGKQAELPEERSGLISRITTARVA